MKRKHKGFTLVELIVVLVILAILAAILVPALLGYIDRAKQSQILVRARAAYTAAQSLASEAYAKRDNPEDAVADDQIADLASLEFDGTKSIFGADYDKTNTNAAMYTIEEFYYQEGDLIVRYTRNPSEWVFVDEMGGGVNISAVDAIASRKKGAASNPFLQAHASNRTDNMIQALSDAGVSPKSYTIYRPWYGSEYWYNVASLPEDAREKCVAYVGDQLAYRPAFTFVITLDGSAEDKPDGTVVPVKKYWYTEYAAELVCVSTGTAVVKHDGSTVRLLNEKYSSESFIYYFEN